MVPITRRFALFAAAFAFLATWLGGLGAARADGDTRVVLVVGGSVTGMSAAARIASELSTAEAAKDLAAQGIKRVVVRVLEKRAPLEERAIRTGPMGLRDKHVTIFDQDHQILHENGAQIGPRVVEQPLSTQRMLDEHKSQMFFWHRLGDIEKSMKAGLPARQSFADGHGSIDIEFAHDWQASYFGRSRGGQPLVIGRTGHAEGDFIIFADGRHGLGAIMANPTDLSTHGLTAPNGNAHPRPNVLVAGDALQGFDGSEGRGVGNGLYTGSLSGIAVARQIRDPQGDHLRHYERLVTEHNEKMFEHHHGNAGHSFVRRNGQPVRVATHPVQMPVKAAPRLLSAHP